MRTVQPRDAQGWELAIERVEESEGRLGAVLLRMVSPTGVQYELGRTTVARIRGTFGPAAGPAMVTLTDADAIVTLSRSSRGWLTIRAIGQGFDLLFDFDWPDVKAAIDELWL